MEGKIIEESSMEKGQVGFGLSSFGLKMIAIISMTIDHTGFILFPQAMWLRAIGRLAFPIFCFTLVEGFCHTHDLKHYIRRMLIVGILAEIPFNLAESGHLLEPGYQNVFFTLLIGLIMMHYCAVVSDKVLKAGVVVLAMLAADMMRTDYGDLGVLLIAIFWFFRKNKQKKLILSAVWNILFFLPVQLCGALASLPISLYNGQKGRNTGYFFYLYYPLHLLILYGISCLIAAG